MQSKKESTQKKFRNVVLVNVSLMVFDNTALICSFLLAITGNNAFALLTIALMGFHASFTLMVIALLRKVLQNDNSAPIAIEKTTETK